MPPLDFFPFVGQRHWYYLEIALLFSFYTLPLLNFLGVKDRIKAIWICLLCFHSNLRQESFTYSERQNEQVFIFRSDLKLAGNGSYQVVMLRIEIGFLGKNGWENCTILHITISCILFILDILLSMSKIYKRRNASFGILLGKEYFCCIFEL